MYYNKEEYIDNRGALKTELLFEETIKPERRDNYSPLFTLREYDTELPSVYKIYMNSVDEYEAAMTILGSTRHWRRLCGLKWFMEGIPEKGFDGLRVWRKDMEMRDRSLAKRQLKKKAEEGNFSAQKVLYNGNIQYNKKFSKTVKESSEQDKKRIDNIREIFGTSK